MCQTKHTRKRVNGKREGENHKGSGKPRERTNVSTHGKPLISTKKILLRVGVRSQHTQSVYTALHLRYSDLLRISGSFKTRLAEVFNTRPFNN